MKIVQYRESICFNGQGKVMVAWSRLRGRNPRSGRLKELVAGFLTSPLNDTEYALLKRVSGIVGTAVAVYLTLAAFEHGTGGTRPPPFFSVGLHKVTVQVREPGQEAM